MISNPFPVDATLAMSGRYRYPDGALKLSFDRQDIVQSPIQLLPPGGFDLYVQVANDEQPAGIRRIELGLGDALALLEYERPTRRQWVGPIRFQTQVPATSIELRGDAEVRLVSWWLEPAGARLPAELGDVVANRTSAWSTVWIDLPRRSLAPAWFKPGVPIEVVVRATAPARIACDILDVRHVTVARHQFTASPAALHLERLPVPDQFGPYLVRCSGAVGARSPVEMQRVVARVAAPVAPSSMLGGHAPHELLTAMGAGWNRTWDSGGTRDRLVPRPIETLSVLEGDLTNVRRIVRTHRGRIRAWEIFNEPYHPPVEPWVAQHVGAVRAAAAVIREEDPAALVVTGGPPEEIDPDHRWWTTLAAAGLLREVDVIAVHMYGGGGGLQPLDIDLRFHAFARWLRQLADAHGATGTPVWDTESGIGPNESFYLGRPVEYGYWDSTGFHPHAPVPYRVGIAMGARLLLLHLWHRIPWFCYQGAASFGNSHALVDFDSTPLPLTVAIAQLVRLVGDARPDGVPAVPPGVFAVAFRTNDQRIVAIWATGGGPDVISGLDITLPAGVVATDVFGNPSTPTTLGIEPILVTGPPALVARALASLRVGR